MFGVPVFFTHNISCVVEWLARRTFRTPLAAIRCFIKQENLSSLSTGLSQDRMQE